MELFYIATMPEMPDWYIGFCTAEEAVCRLHDEFAGPCQKRGHKDAEFIPINGEYGKKRRVGVHETFLA